MTENKKENPIYYTPKQVAYNTGLPYSKILEAIKTEELPAIRERKNKSYLIEQYDLVDYLASLDDELKDELIVSFKEKVPKEKVKELTEELIEAFNKAKIPLSLNIESK